MHKSTKTENSIFPPREFCNLFFASIVFDFVVFHAASDESDEGKKSSRMHQNKNGGETKA